MPMRKNFVFFSILLVFCYSFIDFVFQIPYGIRALSKIVFFLIIPFVYTYLHKSSLVQISEILSIKKVKLNNCIAFSALIYVLIVGSYFVLGSVFDLSNIVPALNKINITKYNFYLVFLYISVVNSFLEEFFFRGFLFSNFLKLERRWLAYFLSSILFAFYHIPIIFGWVSTMLTILAFMVLVFIACIFNYLNEKSHSIYPSWLIHISANLAINTVGAILFFTTQ